ncbi:hypothetical protein MTO96_014766 [Rhipicephalus appendiculatus]
MFDALIPNRTDKAALLAERQYNYYQRVPAEVTVEVFVISDQIHQRRFTQTQHLLGYMCVMINSANLRLQDTNAPRIKLLLIGLERVQSAQDEPYLKGDDKYMDDTATITVLVEYIKTRKHLYGDPDAVYLATGRDMYAMDSGVPDTRRKGNGLAFVAGVCTELFVAIGEDNAGSYDGMHALTHEVAHLLGAAHDGDEPKTNIVPGHPGALACPFSQGYIMSYLNTGPNYHRFSSCSVVQMRYVMRLRGPLCWRVKSQGHKVDGYYPGMLVTPQNICKYKFPRESSVTADTSAAVLTRCKVRCVYTKRRYLYGQVYDFPVQVEFEAPDHARCGNKTGPAVSATQELTKVMVWLTKTTFHGHVHANLAGSQRWSVDGGRKRRYIALEHSVHDRIHGGMATSSLKRSVLFLACFSVLVIHFTEGVQTGRLVYPRLLEERSSDGGLVVKVHDDLTLNPEKRFGGGPRTSRAYGGKWTLRHTILMVTKTGSGVRMEGLVSPSHRIKPMAVSEKSDDGIVPHEIHEIEHKEMLDKTLTYRSKASKATLHERAIWPRVNVPAVVTVEVFIVLDKWHHRNFTSTTQALWYLCVMVNSANMRYRDASNPRVQLLLTGVDKAENEYYVVTPPR